VCSYLRLYLHEYIIAGQNLSLLTGVDKKVIWNSHARHFHRTDKVYSLNWINCQTSGYILILGIMCFMSEPGVLSWQRMYI
jgi:hypothetical protein